MVSITVDQAANLIRALWIAGKQVNIVWPASLAARPPIDPDNPKDPIEESLKDPLTEDLAFQAKKSGLTHFRGYVGGWVDVNGDGVPPDQAPKERQAGKEPPRREGEQARAVWWGPRAREGIFLRLFTSLDFSAYSDIDSRKLLLVADLRTPTDALAGQAVWVEYGAEVLEGNNAVSKRHLVGGYLQGNIAGGASGGGARGAGGISPSPWCGGGISPSPWCGGGISPSPWCGGGISPSPWCSG